ncbi:hypothetical protein D9M71_816560 [compost metagenome]
MHGLATPTTLGNLVEHAEERRQAGAAGNHHQWPGDVAQVEGSQRRLEDQLIANLATFTHVVAHRPVRQQANQELQLVSAVGLIGERVRTRVIGAWHLNAGVLAG